MAEKAALNEFARNARDWADYWASQYGGEIDASIDDKAKLATVARDLAQAGICQF